MTQEDLTNIIQDVHTKYKKVRILVTSDELDAVRDMVQDKSDVVFLPYDEATCIVMMSFCDVVVANGSYYRSIDNKDFQRYGISKKGYESTFGQVI